MFSVLLLLSIRIVAALAAPLLETINPTLLTSSANIDPSPLNSTALKEADALAQALSLAGADSTQSSHVSTLSPPRHVASIKN